MTSVIAENLVVEFPIYEASSRSFKKKFLRAATGGALKQTAAHKVVVRALNNVSFEFKDGDRVGLIGHNGSGKTTLLRVLAGAFEPVQGSLTIQGRVASMLSITLGMDLDATGYENIFIRGALMGLRKKQIEGLVDEICDFADLGQYINVPLRTYSSGMAMRLAFAVSTSVAADIVLMDEWLSAGDASFAEKAQHRLLGMLDKARILVLASHSEELIRSYCNKILKLNHGELVELEPMATART